MKMFGMQMGETAGDYIIDEDRIVVTANNQSTVFTLNDDGDLESSMLGEKIICRKGGGSGTAAEPTSKLSNSLSASYGGMSCMLDKLTFSDDGKVDLYMDDEQQGGSYIKEGDQVTVTGKGGSLVFTLVGDNLESTFDGQNVVCSKL
jgi:hypothetical protein